jgi:NAD(P)-dependent dehydrogenase (short-subunit alcohol dehydrogenase family)
MSSLKNKIAVVTGGSSGIGLATAKRFVEDGAYAFIAGPSHAELDKAFADIGSNVTGVKTDISKLDDLDHVYEAIAKRGKIDVIFAGAARVETMMTAAATPEHFEKTFGTNARGTYFTVQKALPHLNDGASVILVASAGKNKGLPGRGAYSATTAALVPVYSGGLSGDYSGLNRYIFGYGPHRDPPDYPPTSGSAVGAG